MCPEILRAAGGLRRFSVSGNGKLVTADCVLVTGAFGLVGSAVVAELAGQGRRVVATDLDVPGIESARKRWPRGRAWRCGGPT